MKNTFKSLRQKF